ncbi:MAG: hypothetical protein M0D55_18055 [Elusimicrobiota bacterium]|nr:MAG: hypothetical protein M0D55_18055 [Elusimicrobiota bacterium]
MNRSLLVLAAALAAAGPARAVEFVPVFGGTFLLGQVLENGRSTSWNGNATLQFTPAMKFSESWGLIPTYAGAYQGNKNIADLGSGGQLFQDSMSHSVRAKGVWKRGDWKLKPQAGYRWELLRETTDESWGEGLFDYRKPSFGLEAEWAASEAVTLGASADWYRIEFPNYRSLESSVKSQGLGREQASARTLDSVNTAWTGTASFPFAVPGVKTRVVVSWTDRRFPEQNIVLPTGSLSSERRGDSIKNVGLNLGRGWRLGDTAGVYVDLQGSWTRLDSTQNHYDAEASRFTGDYYSFEETAVQPRAVFSLGRRKVELGIAYLNTRRQYLSRRAQSEGGTHLDDAMVLNQDNFFFDLAVPLGRGFRLLVNSTAATARSNQRYQKFFKTNYTLQSHMLGFSYSY